MVEEELPGVASKVDLEALPAQKAHKVSISESPPVLESDVENSQHPRMPIRTNDVWISWTRGDPGDIIEWHTHVPDMYQILIVLEGECRWHYLNNDGEEQTITAEADEVVYLPAGATNKVEVIGEEHHTHMAVSPVSTFNRVEHQLGGAPYTMDEFNVGLWFDSIRDEIVEADEDALIE